MEYKELGNNIKKARKKSGLTQKELGRLIYKSEITIRKYESGDYKIPKDVLLNLSEILNTDLKTLTGSDYNKFDDIEKTEDAFKKIAKELIPVMTEVKNKQKELDKLIKDFLSNPLIISSINLDFDYNTLTSRELIQIENNIFLAIQLKINEIINARNRKNDIP